MERNRTDHILRVMKAKVKEGKARQLDVLESDMMSEGIGIYAVTRDDQSARYAVIDSKGVHYEFKEETEARHAAAFMKAVREAKELVDRLVGTERSILTQAGMEVERRADELSQANAALDKAFVDVWQDDMESVYADMMED